MIDFTADALDLIYLVEVEYRMGTATLSARWCGPPVRVGRGAAIKHPQSGKVVQWEPRISGARINYDLGGLKDSVPRVSAVAFTVQAGGAESAALRAAAKDGTWANGKASMWLHDRSSGVSQHAGTGKTDRNPTARSDAGFSLSLRLFPFPPDLRWPAYRIPDSVPAEWDTTQHLWTSFATAPTDYAINPNHKGKYRCHAFGSATDAIWMEAVPYGVIVGKTFVFVSPKLHGFVDAIRWDHDGTVYDTSDSATWGGQTIRTIHQTHSDRGPVGTTCVFTHAAGLGTVRPLWWGSQLTGEGKRDKIMIRVSGYNFALEATSHPSWDPVLGNFYNFGANDSADPGPTPEDAGGVRDRYDHILDDLVTDPDFLGLGNVFGANALSDFVARAPSVAPAFANRACAVPLEIVEEPPTFREVLGGLMQTLQADLCVRFDPSADEMRVFPIWRGPRTGEPPRWKFHQYHLAKVEQPRSIREMDDPWSDYATRVVVKSAEFYDPPVAGDSGEIAPKEQFARLFVDGQEEVEGFAGERQKTIAFKHWLHQGPADSSGFVEAARYTADHLTQRQRVVEATFGRCGFQVQLGDLVQYDVSGTVDTVGQVRRVSLDLDKMQATIRTLHINAFESLGTDGRASGDEK